MDIPPPDKNISVDLEFLKKLKDKEDLDVLSLLLSQRSMDQSDVRRWVGHHIEKRIRDNKSLYEKEESPEKRTVLEAVIKELEFLNRDIQNGATVYGAY